MDNDNDDAPIPMRTFIWLLDELIDEARGRGLPEETIAAVLEDFAGALRQGVS